MACTDHKKGSQPTLCRYCKLEDASVDEMSELASCTDDRD